MTIVERKTGQDGTLWGWDDEVGQWLELDESAEQGSTLGNLGRAALRGFRDVGQGISELTPLEETSKIHPEVLTPEAERRFAEGRALEAEQQAAATSAPIAEAVGGSAPEVAAGLGAAAVTGGIGLPAAILGQMGAGAATGFLRPGTTVERATNAALGAVFGLAGEIPAGAQMVRGAMLGLKMGEAVTGRAAGRSADVLDMGLLRAETAAARQGELAAPGSHVRSAGAAATPEGELGEQAARENLALEADEATGANVSSASDARDRQWAEENLGYKSPLGSGTHAGSGARMAEAVDEYTLGGTINKTFRANNQKLMSRTAAQAMGLPDAATKDVIELDDLAMSMGRLENVYDDLEKAAPDVNAKDTIAAIRAVKKQGGSFESTSVEKWLDKTVDNLGKLEVEDGATMMANLRRIRTESTLASKNGDQHGAEMLLEPASAHQRFDGAGGAKARQRRIRGALARRQSAISHHEDAGGWRECRRDQGHQSEIVAQSDEKRPGEWWVRLARTRSRHAGA